jgi:pyridoxine kinase
MVVVMTQAFRSLSFVPFPPARTLQSTPALWQADRAFQRPKEASAMSVLSITSHVVLARVGHAVQAPVFQRLSIPYWAVPTVTLAGHGGEVRPGGGPLDPAVFDDLLDAVAANRRFTGCEVVMSGYLGAASAVAAVARVAAAAKAGPLGASFVCDPVLGDDGTDGARGGLYVPPDLAEAMRDRLVPTADVVVPNRFEASWLSGVPVETVADAETAARSLIRTGARVCIVTGVPAPDDRVASVLVSDDAAPVVIATPRVHGCAKGAGDLFTALFVAHVLGGAPPPHAVEWASIGVGRALAFAADDGNADLPVVENIDAVVDVEGSFGPMTAM